MASGSTEHQTIAAFCAHRDKIEELLGCIGTAEQAVTQLRWPSDGWTAADGAEVGPSAAAALAWLESLSEEGR